MMQMQGLLNSSSWLVGEGWGGGYCFFVRFTGWELSPGKALTFGGGCCFLCESLVFITGCSHLPLTILGIAVW